MSTDSLDYLPKDMSEAKRLVTQWRSRALEAEAKLCKTCNGYGAVGSNHENSGPCPECCAPSIAYYFYGAEPWASRSQGIGFGVLNPVETHDFAELIGKFIMVDGIIHKVRAVERNMHMPPYCIGERIVIWVGEKP